MARQRVPIAWKFVLAYMAGAALFSWGLISQLVLRQRDQLMAEVVKKGDAVTRLFARSVTTAIFALDVASLENQISHVQGLEDVGEVLVFNEKGQCITDGTRTNPRLGDPVDGAVVLLATPPKKPRRDATDERLQFMAPVILGDRATGGVRLDFSLGHVVKQVRAMRDALSLLALVLTALGALPVWLISNYLIKPLIFGDA